jgi:intracellular sulfur oxidation DsrE/DsrF family protein|tara:strand:- start:636 stop:1487 length:852 start_codon:yes stop_codon:yes gene_type:complete
LKNILALGNAASDIVSELEKHGMYKVYRICNQERAEKKNTYIIPELETAENYEALNILSKIKFLRNIKKEVTFFVCGASKSSALSLKILESLHKKGVSIKVVYFQPEVEFLSEEQTLQEKAVRNILQEYARSGLFENITLVCNKTLEAFNESVNVFDYYKQINSVFCDSYHMTEVFKNTKPIMSTFSRIIESCRIRSLGVSTPACEDRLFSPFKQEVEVVYYFGINEEKLKTQGNFFKELTKSVKARMSDETKAYFGIYPTQYENDYIYVEYFSPKIQLTDEE